MNNYDFDLFVIGAGSGGGGSVSRTVEKTALLHFEWWRDDGKTIRSADVRERLTAEAYVWIAKHASFQTSRTLASCWRGVTYAGRWSIRQVAEEGLHRRLHLRGPTDGVQNACCARSRSWAQPALDRSGGCWQETELRCARTRRVRGVGPVGS